MADSSASTAPTAASGASGDMILGLDATPSQQTEAAGLAADTEESLPLVAATAAAGGVYCESLPAAMEDVEDVAAGCKGTRDKRPASPDEGADTGASKRSRLQTESRSSSAEEVGVFGCILREICRI